MQITTFLGAAALITSAVLAAPQPDHKGPFQFKKFNYVEGRDDKKGNHTRHHHDGKHPSGTGIISGQPPLMTGTSGPYPNGTQIDNTTTCTSAPVFTSYITTISVITSWVSPISANTSSSAFLTGTGTAYSTSTDLNTTSTTSTWTASPNMNNTTTATGSTSKRGTRTRTRTHFVTVTQAPTNTTSSTMTSTVVAPSTIVTTSGMIFSPITTGTLYPTSTQNAAATTGKAVSTPLCGLRGLPIGKYKLGEMWNESADVNVDLQSCADYCAGIEGLTMGCKSYSYYLEDYINSPRCDFFGASVKQSLDTVIPSVNRVWYDLACPVPTTNPF